MSHIFVTGGITYVAGSGVRMADGSSAFPSGSELKIDVCNYQRKCCTFAKEPEATFRAMVPYGHACFKVGLPWENTLARQFELSIGFTGTSETLLMDELVLTLGSYGNDTELVCEGQPVISLVGDGPSQRLGDGCEIRAYF